MWLENSCQDSRWIKACLEVSNNQHHTIPPLTMTNKLQGVVSAATFWSIFDFGLIFFEYHLLSTWPLFAMSRTMLQWEALGKNTSAFAQYKLFHNLFDVKFKSVFKYIVGNIYFNWRKKIAFDDFLKYFFCGSPSKVILQEWYLRSVQAPWDYETKICCQLGKCRSVMQLQISNFFTYKV